MWLSSEKMKNMWVAKGRKEAEEQLKKSTESLIKLHQDRETELRGKYEKLVHDMEINFEKKEHRLSMETERKVAELERKHADELHRLKTELTEEFMSKEKTLLNRNFDQLSTSLEELHSKGNSTTKLLEGIAMKAMENRVPQLTHRE